MITPSNFGKYINDAILLYRNVELQIYTNICQLLHKGGSAEDAQEWKRKQLQKIQKLDGQNKKILKAASKIAKKDVSENIEKVGEDTAGSTHAELRRSVPQNDSVHLPRQMLREHVERYVNQLLGYLGKNVNRAVLSGKGAAAKLYRAMIDRIVLNVERGMAFEQAVENEVFGKIGEGVKSGFKDSAGRDWSLEFYVALLMREMVNGLYNKVREDTLLFNEHEFVLVSSHPNARPACSLIQGNVCSLRRVSSLAEYPSIYDFGYGTPAGIRGINCRHILFPFAPGVHTNTQTQYGPEEAQKRARFEAEQRRRERAIREAKKGYEIADALSDSKQKERFSRLIRNREEGLRKFLKDKDFLRRQREREEIKYKHKNLGGM